MKRMHVTKVEDVSMSNDDVQSQLREIFADAGLDCNDILPWGFVSENEKLQRVFHRIHKEKIPHDEVFKFVDSNLDHKRDQAHILSHEKVDTPIQRERLDRFVCRIRRSIPELQKIAMKWYKESRPTP